MRPLRRVTVTTVVSAAVGGMLAVLAVVLAAAVTGRPADGAWLLGAMGLGNLVGSAALAVRPLTAEPVRATLVLTAALGVGYLLVALASGYALLLGAFAVVGVLTAPWITASLATRERHAPPGRRAEVFAGMAGWKMAAASAGTALAGLLAAAPARTVVAVAAALVLGRCARHGAGPAFRHARHPAPRTGTMERCPMTRSVTHSARWARWSAACSAISVRSTSATCGPRRAPAAPTASTGSAAT